MPNKIRIIGGQWRGKKLQVIDNLSLRPTKDNVRETLFNWLNPYLRDAHCLDCFAGSGVLGIEAISRYASSAILLELKNPIVLQLKKNLQKLKAHQCTVIKTNTIEWLRYPKKQFNIVFVDPPFNTSLLEKTLILLEQNNWLTHNALIYIEKKSNGNIVHTPSNWEEYKKKTSGQVLYSLYKRKSTN